MRRLLAAVLVVAVTGCSVSHSNKGTAMVGGTAIAVAGLVIARPKPVDSDNNGTNDFFLNDDYSGLLPGTLLFIGGMALLIAGLNARDPEPAFVPPIAPAPMPAAMPAPVLVEPVLPPLPEIAVTVEVMQLAKQCRSAAARGHCDAALTTWARIAVLDGPYAAALRVSPVLAPCPSP